MSNEKPTAITGHDAMESGALLSIGNLERAMRVAEMLSKSDLVPNDYKGRPGNILAAIQMGHEIGLAPMQALQGIAVINGRPSVWGDALLALCKGHPHCQGIDESFITDADGNVIGARCEAKRHGFSPVVREFTIRDAEDAGLLHKKGPWQQYRPRMLQMRARGFACRDQFADVLKGISLAEEARDMDPEPKIIVREDDGQPLAPWMEDAHKRISAHVEKPPAKTNIAPGESFDDAFADLLSQADSVSTEEELQECRNRANALRPSMNEAQTREIRVALDAAKKAVRLPSAEQLLKRQVAANDKAIANGMDPQDWKKHVSVAVGAPEPRTWEDLDKIDAYVEAHWGRNA